MSQKELWRIRKLVQRWFPTDGERCENCGSSKKLERHHIDGNITHNPKDGSNIAFLCKGCHIEAHYGVSYRLRNMQEVN